MGSSASKASRAAGTAQRQYPKQPSLASTTNATRPPPPSRTRPGPSVKPQPEAYTSRSAAVNADALDPDFAKSLRTIGPIQPDPTLSPSSTVDVNSIARPSGPNPKANPALMVLEARAKLQDEADRETASATLRGSEGRQFLEVHTIRHILALRDEENKSALEIEKALGLKSGVVERLGPRNIVGLVHEVGRERREVDLV